MPPKKATRTIPHNLEAEQSVLGCILYDSDTASDILTGLKPDDFYSESHKFIFEAMTSVFNRNNPVDFVTLADELETKGTMGQAGGISYITSITTSVPSSANFRHYMDIVKRDSVMRKLIRASNEIIETAHGNVTKEDAIAYAEKCVFDIGTQSESSELSSLESAITEVITKFQQIETDKNAFKGLSTGFNALDNLLNGLHKSDLILIAARPSMGKSSLAMNIVENAAVFHKASCAVFSLEMPKVQIAQRMVCSIARVPMTKALKGQLGLEEWENLWKANKLLTGAKVFVDDSSLITPPEILSKCRKLKAKYGLDLIMIDYIQLMSGSKKTDNRQQEISEISRSLKIIAKEINVPVIALSQLSRAVESRSNRRPQLSDLRESGAIEQDADIVMFIHRPDRVEENQSKIASGTMEKDVVEILIEKHRNGPTGSIFLGWTGEYTKFENTDKRADYIAAAYGVPKQGGKKPEKVEANSSFGQPPPEQSPPPSEKLPWEE